MSIFQKRRLAFIYTPILVLCVMSMIVGYVLDIAELWLVAFMGCSLTAFAALLDLIGKDSGV